MTSLWAVFTIIIINIALSGDNAAVIGLAIKKLPDQKRKQAAFIGAGGAIALRVILTALATILIKIKFLDAIGGIILIWITWKLLADSDEEGDVASNTSFWGAINTIIIADLSMSFDNVMGVAGAANGSITLLIFGLLVSIPIVVAGSNLLAKLMNRYPIIIYLGGAVLGHTALTMIFEDQGLNLAGFTGNLLAELLPWLAAVGILAWGWLHLKSEPVFSKENIDQ